MYVTQNFTSGDEFNQPFFDNDGFSEFECFDIKFSKGFCNFLETDYMNNNTDSNKLRFLAVKVAMSIFPVLDEYTSTTAPPKNPKRIKKR